jgi:hypothetical protein
MKRAFAQIVELIIFLLETIISEYEKTNEEINQMI